MKLPELMYIPARGCEFRANVGSLSMRGIHEGQHDIILAFYGEGACDDRGRSLTAIWSMTDAQLERAHDYIKWLFPLPETRDGNPATPMLQPETIAAFKERVELQRRLRRSYDRMLQFYGLAMIAGEVKEEPNFRVRANDWLQPGNHNHLRLTRIIRSLRYLGLESEAQALYHRLGEIYTREPGKITATTFWYWRRAANKPV
jgi:hypothetical protein